MSSQPVFLIANGDLRESANRACESAQAAVETLIVAAVEREGWTVRRGHPFIEQKGHGFIDSQKYAMEVFRTIPDDVPQFAVRRRG